MSFGMVAISYLSVMPPSWPDYTGIAPAYNQPTVTTSAVGAGASTTIAGSAGWYREKRAGVAETAPGGSQTSANALDTSGSTYFGYYGVPSATALGASPGNYVEASYKPGGDAVFARWLFTTDLVTNATEIEYRLQVVTTNGLFGMICVDGLRISSTGTVNITSPPNAGSGAGVKLTFPDSRSRRITIYGMNSSTGGGRFGGIAVNAGASVTKAITPVRTIVVLGDSYVNGSTGTSAVTTFAAQLALKMGADNFVGAGIGGTGFIQTINSDPNSTFAGRVSDILAMNPTAVIIAGGRSDTVSGLQASVESLLTSLSSVPERYVVPTASESGQSSVRSAIQAACVSQGVTYVDAAIDSLEKIGDGVHPTYNGHQALAADVFTKITS